VSGGHEQHPLVHVEELTDLSGHFPSLLPVSSDWFSVHVWEYNLGLQVKRPILLTTAYEGLQNCSRSSHKL